MAQRSIYYEAPPEKSDEGVFSLTFEYEALVESPSRLFRSAAQFIEAFSALDAAAASAIDPNLETALVLLSVEQGSMRTWFASILRTVDDEALKDLDWKKQIGAYLVKTKYLALKWLEEGEPQKRLSDLQQQIAIEARETDVLHIPAYRPPSRALLLEGLRRTENAKDLLLDEDHVIYSVKGDAIWLDPGKKNDLSELSDIQIESQTSFDVNRAALVVKKPDLLGRSQWQLKFRERTVASSILDSNWLARFHAREIVLRPGDALVCDGRITILFDRSGTPISEKAVITKVYGIEYQPPPQPEFFS